MLFRIVAPALATALLATCLKGGGNMDPVLGRRL